MVCAIPIPTATKSNYSVVSRVAQHPALTITSLSPPSYSTDQSPGPQCSSNTSVSINNSTVSPTSSQTTSSSLSKWSAPLYAKMTGRRYFSAPSTLLGQHRRSKHHAQIPRGVPGRVHSLTVCALSAPLPVKCMRPESLPC